MIIIETTTRERLVLVPEKQIVCTTHTRDATPEDLARGGFVPAEEMPEALRRQRDDWQRKAESLLARAERAERLREECESVLTAMGARAREAEELARVLEVERDTLLAELADAKAERDRAIRDCAATAAERNEARAEVARLGVAHERARQQPAQDRATDEELERVYSNAYARAWESEVSTPDRGERAGLRAVAARVRQERCLIAQAVAANVDIRVCEDNGNRFMLGVHAPGCDEVLVRGVPASEAPSTLARLLGEVSRG